jgi:nucleoside-diphosphate-sugar epimerase
LPDELLEDSVERLEERLSRPSEEDAQAMRSMQGDLMILGVGGKMGPTLARLAQRALDTTGLSHQVFAVARFTNRDLTSQLKSQGIRTISSDLLEPGALEALPDAPNVIFMAAKKFGTSGAEHMTWALNTYLPGRVVERFRKARIVAFSTGNVYPLRPISQGGSVESDTPAPVGEYAQSALGRERMFEYGSSRWGTPVCILRLNYAVELRYGVLVDIGTAVFERRPVNLRNGWVNVIWQRDANSVCLRSFALCTTPPKILNVTGPETLSVRSVALRFGEIFGITPVFESQESETALLNNAAECHRLLGTPSVTANDLIDWTARWIKRGGATLNKPTHFEAQDGRF